MSEDRPAIYPPQPLLFDLDESTARLELFPAVWSAAESLVSKDTGVRRDAFEQLVELQAPRYSPLVAYVIATRISDPDIPFRARIVNTLGEVLSPDVDGLPAPEHVRQTLTAYLAQMRTRHTFALLQALVEDPSLEKHVALLLNASPYAGNHLGDILSDRKVPMEVRKQAGRMIGRVGFLDALPTLERLSTRLQARLNGQSSMPFAPHSPKDELDLLPIIQTALTLLRAP